MINIDELGATCHLLLSKTIHAEILAMDTEWSQHRILFQLSSREPALGAGGKNKLCQKRIPIMSRLETPFRKKLYYLISPTPPTSTTPTPLVFHKLQFPDANTTRLRLLAIASGNH